MGRLTDRLSISLHIIKRYQLARGGKRNVGRKRQRHFTTRTSVGHYYESLLLSQTRTCDKAFSLLSH